MHQNMSGKIRILVLFSAMAFCLSSGLSFSKGLSNGIGPTGHPDPWSLTDVKVELAEGEKYVLSGRLVMGPGVFSPARQVYLAIDLEKQPWLASEKRKAFPFYQILNPEILLNSENWQKKNVIVSVVVRSQIERSPDDKQFVHVLKLEVTEPPTFAE